MYLTPDERQVGRENFYAAVGSKHVRRSKGNTPSRDFLLKGIQQGIASRKGLGAYYFGYENKVKEPLRVGVIGTGDEGSVLLGAINPEFIQQIGERTTAQQTPALIDKNIHRLLSNSHYMIDKPCQDGMNDLLVCFT